MTLPRSNVRHLPTNRVVRHRAVTSGSALRRTADEPAVLLAADASFHEWLAARGGFRWTTRRVPGLTWLTVTLTLSGRCQPGHGWIVQGIVRRDTFVVGGRGFVLTAMPKKQPKLGQRGRNRP